MFVSFEPLVFLLWVVLSSIVPGAILSFSIFRKDEGLNPIEKLLIGFALGLIILPLIPFLLYLLLGVKFSYGIALLSVGLLYAIALAFFVLKRTYEDIRLPPLKMEGLTVSKGALISGALLIILLLTYLVRIGPYSPIFQELDPYYYTYTAHQLLSLGENPFDDQTAWYPEVTVNHRIIPALSYLEATWYSLYSGGGAVEDMLLALIASMYPPIAAVLAVFFLYLLVSVTSKREWGLIAAGLVSFVPIFIYKLAAGEHEVQPYAFFALAFFYAMYALSLKRKGFKFPLMAGLGFAAVALGSSSQILALVSVLLFMVFQSIAYFLRDNEEANLGHLLKVNAIVFAIGPFLGSAILKDVFANGMPSPTIAVPFFIGLLLVGALYLIKRLVHDRAACGIILAIILFIGMVFFAFTPLGDYVKKVGKSGFEIAEYINPLDRTIAEQGSAATSFGSQIGFIAETYSGIVKQLLWPFTSLLGPQSAAASQINGFFSSLLSLIFLPVTVIVNLILSIFVGIVNIVLDTNVGFSEKDGSMLQLWLLLFWIAIAYSLYRFAAKGEDNLSLLMLAIIMPPLVVGIIKAKYTIYSGVLLAVAIGFTLGAALNAGREFLNEDKLRSLARGLFALGAALLLLQFVYNAFAPSQVWGSLQPLYQNDPAALTAKFKGFCSESMDATVCAAANDPMGYASRGTNQQYDQKLCLLSIYSKYQYLNSPGLAPAWESQAAYFRCQRLSDYWISSMEWIEKNTESGARIISWWDYGHWINYFGQRNAVLRNEHRSHEMIGAVADKYLDAKPAELKAYMQAHDSEYALFDLELVYGGGNLGGKYGALNYLSCAWSNETNVSFSPGISACEEEHLWETIFVTSVPCTISSLTNKTGFTAYKLYGGSANAYLTYYPSLCYSPQDQQTASYCKAVLNPVPAYCVGEVMLASGDKTMGTYSLNETYPNGDLKLNKAILEMGYSLPSTYHFGPASGFTLFYTKDQIWLENGQVKSGYEDRKGKFYDSALYQALFLDELDGFEQVYTDSYGAVKIYKIK